MALLLRDREAGAEASPQPPGDGPVPRVPDFACETCGAAMERGQDWCLECGTAAPGRLGARPGWRAAVTVVGVTLLLLCSAVVASYAALTSDAERSASQPPAGSADPIVAQTPGAVVPQTAPTAPVQPGATGPGVTAPAAPTAPSGTQPIIPVQPPPAVGNAPATVLPPPPPPPPAAASGNQGSTTQSGTSSNSGGSATTTPTVQAIKLGDDDASTYDPTKRAGAEFGPAKNAIDGKEKTVWDVVVPADGQPLGVGLLIDLGAAYKLSSLRIHTPTRGFDVELYGAVDDKEVPVDVIDKRWIHLADGKDVEDVETIKLADKGDGKKFKLFLLHFTQPGEPTDPRVAIGELEFRGSQ